jgi:hypothetical protein
VKRTAVLSVAVLLLITACVDEPQKLMGPARPALEVSSSPPGSTVCVAYAKALERAQANAAARPGVAGLLHSVSVLSAVFTDACR